MKAAARIMEERRVKITYASTWKTSMTARRRAITKNARIFVRRVTHFQGGRRNANGNNLD